MNLDGPLVTTKWLEEHLDEAALRIFDTTVFLTHKKDGAGYLPVSGREQWQAGHIPGAGFLDIIKDLSDQTTAIPFTMPPADQFAATMASHGVSDDAVVVLYNQGFPMWSTRLWWMLRSIGFDRVAVLDGGWDKWQREARPVSDVPPELPTGNLKPRPRPEMWVDKDAMLEMINGAAPAIINALSPAVYSGEKNQYGRPGHLPGTYNVFYGDLLDSDSGEFLPREALSKLFESSRALDSDRVVTYCGGGISATMDSLALMLCGQTNVAVYDGSMSEWVKDESLPLKLGSEP